MKYEVEKEMKESHQNIYCRIERIEILLKSISSLNTVQRAVAIVKITLRPNPPSTGAEHLVNFHDDTASSI